MVVEVKNLFQKYFDRKLAKLLVTKGNIKLKNRQNPRTHHNRLLNCDLGNHRNGS